jgi:glucokinase
MFLAADIGGTKTDVALVEAAGDDLRWLREATFPSGAHASLEEILVLFHDQAGRPPLRAVCCGVAGPVVDGKCQATNLPWFLDEQKLAQAVGAPRGKLLNDLEATAYGMLFLRPDELAVLNACAQPPRKGHVAVIAAGTGLGEAILFWDGQQHHPMASEGGHADFAPQTEEEVELLRYLWREFHEHVSYERVLSGPGFADIYRFLRDRGPHPEPPWLAEKLKAADDPNPIITEAGLAGADPLCVATLQMFCRIYGAEAGNLALKCLALGGVYVGGGIAPKMLPALQKGDFLAGFVDKGRFEEFMRKIPVYVSLNEKAALLGAAHYALRG